MPNRDLCTAVCSITTFRNRLVLIKNKRGWEFPGGHIEQEETIEEAIEREAREEACAKLRTPKMFGFKKISSLHRAPYRNNPSLFYPFPHAYVVFFYAEVDEFLDIPHAADVESISVVNYREAQELLKENGQYAGILEYLIEQNIINISLSDS